MTTNDPHDGALTMTTATIANDELATVTIGHPDPDGMGFSIPRAPDDDGRARAGFVGDYRPLVARLADPHTPKDRPMTTKIDHAEALGILHSEAKTDVTLHPMHCEDRADLADAAEELLRWVYADECEGTQMGHGVAADVAREFAAAEWAAYQPTT